MKPDNRETTFANLTVGTQYSPRIVFDAIAIKWIRALVKEHDAEVGFYAIVDEIKNPDDNNEENTYYYIRDVFYPKHSEMNSATCEISGQGETDMMEWLVNKEKSDDILKVLFWGHSHHNMGTSPSSQDESEALKKMEKSGKFYIRAIVNKSEEMSVSFFDYKRKIRFDNIKWEIDNSSTELQSQRAIDDIVEIIGGNVLSASEKIHEIFTTCTTDEIANKITEKVKELKKENAPPVQYGGAKPAQWASHNNGYNNYYGNRHLPYTPPALPKPGLPNVDPWDEYDEIYTGTHGRVGRELISNSDIDGLIKEIVK